MGVALLDLSKPLDHQDINNEPFFNQTVHAFYPCNANDQKLFARFLASTNRVYASLRFTNDAPPW